MGLRSIWTYTQSVSIGLLASTMTGGIHEPSKYEPLVLIGGIAV